MTAGDSQNEVAPSPERHNGKALMCGVVVMLTAVLLSGHVLRSLVGQDRIVPMVDALPSIAQASQKNSVLFVGSSAVLASFSPDAFDEESRKLGLPLVSYNLGLGAANPDALLPLSRRIAKVFRKEQFCPEAVLFEFAPLLATRARAEWDINRARRAYLLSVPLLVTDAQRSLSEASKLLGLWMLGGNQPDDAIAALNGRLFENDLAAPGWVDDPAVAAQYQLGQRKALQAILQMKPGPGPDPLNRWDAGLHGGFSSAVEQAQDIRKRLVPSIESFHKKDLIRRSDVLGLHFDPDAIEDTISAIRELQSVTKTVYLVLMPRNVDLALPPDSRARLDAAIDQITQSTGIAFIDLSERPEFQPSDFADVTHISRASGRQKLSPLLAAEVVRLLGEHH